MSTKLKQDELNFKLLSLNLETDYSKIFCAICSSLLFSIMFYYIHVIVESIFSKRNEQLSIITYEKYNGKINNPKLEAKKIMDSLWMIKNLQISFIHSTLCAIFIIFTVYRVPDMFDDLILHTSNESYLLVAFSIGYFFYDFFDMCANNKVLEMWVVTGHHFIVISLFSYHITNVYCLGYSLIALCMEFNSVFLHARKLAKLYGCKKSDTVYKIISFFNFLTFIIFRFGVLIYLFHDIYKYNHRLSKNYYVLLLCCAIGMTIMNIGLFRQLVLKDFRKSKTTNEAKEN